MIILLHVLASVLVALAAIASAQQLVILTRGSDKQRPPVPVWRAAVFGRAGQRLRLSVVALLFGFRFLISGGPASPGYWLVVGIMVAIFVWDRWVWLRSRIRKQGQPVKTP